MTIDDDDVVTETHGHIITNNNATNIAMDQDEQIDQDQACMQDQKMKDNTTCVIPPTQQATTPAVTARTLHNMQEKNAKAPQNKIPASLKPKAKETKTKAQSRPRENTKIITLQLNKMLIYFNYTKSSAATQDIDIQENVTDQAQITEDEQQHNISNEGITIPPIKITTECEAEKRQPPPPITKNKAANGELETNNKKKARNNQPSFTIPITRLFTYISTALNPGTTTNNTVRNNADKNTSANVAPQPMIPSGKDETTNNCDQTTTEQAHTSHSFKTLTWNCRNLRLNSESLLLLVQENKPDIIFLTETHCLPRLHNKLAPLRDGLRDYHLTLSSFNPPPAIRGAVKLYPRAKAGVLLAVRKNLVHDAGCDIIRHPTPTDLSGYYTGITITSPHGPTTYLATAYVCPSNTELRNRIYKHISKEAINNTDAPHCQGIIGGDWNATLFPTDRSCTTMNHTDKIHAKFVDENRLSPLATRHQPEMMFTYFSETDTINASRIDDAYYFLVNKNTTRAPPPPAPVKEAAAYTSHGMTKKTKKILTIRHHQKCGSSK